MAGKYKPENVRVYLNGALLGLGHGVESKQVRRDTKGEPVEVPKTKRRNDSKGAVRHG